MKFKDILVHLDDAPNCRTRVALAVNLARQHNAFLTGLYVITQPHYQPRNTRAEEQAARAQAIFDEETAASGLASEFVCAEPPVTGITVTEVVNLHAHHKDLVVVGQTDFNSPAGDTPQDLPERLVKTSGRPVLIVPFAGTFPTVGNRVMIAWKSGRESVRALNDAMPMLQDSPEVRILEIASPVAPEHDFAGQPQDISLHLARHGIAATTEKFAAANVPIGDLLLNQAWEGGCDLLVMGAYTNNQRGAVALGPVALHVLKFMTMPVLMSH